MGAQAVRLSNVDIDNALNNKEFEVLFQPIFDLGNGALARVETFVRWRHPSLGVLPPGAFISFFETQGRMSELTRYVLAGALNAYSDWRGPYAPGFSINLALSDLSDDAFTTHFAKVLRDRDFSPDLVTLECPMPPVDLDLNTASAYFARLNETGARLAIEVRGRANDLLRNIDPFPFDEIKTGGSAILRFARTVRGPGLSAIADLLEIASRANAAITAVGVEDQASLAALRGLGFTAAQGNHLAKVGDLSDFRPGRVNEVRKLLELEPLDAESLTALFRTEAPSPSAADSGSETDSGEATAKSVEIVDNLNKRIATTTDAMKKEVEAPATGIKEAGAPSDDAKKAKAREKAKALALAKRAKARDVRKAAAIERAKAKMAHAKRKAEDAKQTNPPSENAFPSARAPRDLQEQLNKEFAAGSDTATPEPESVELEAAEKSKTSEKLAAPQTPAPGAASSEPGALEAAADAAPINEEKPTLSETVASKPSDAGPAAWDPPVPDAAVKPPVKEEKPSVAEIQSASAAKKPDASEPAAPDRTLDLPPVVKEKTATAKDTSDKNKSKPSATKPKDAKPAEPPASASDPESHKKTAGKTEDPAATTDASKAAPVPPPDAADAKDPLDKISMSVGAARAYFRPGIRVGNPALRDDEPTPAPSPQRRPEPPTALEAYMADAPTVEADEDAIPAGTEPSEIDAVLPAGKLTDLMSAPLPQGDLVDVLDKEATKPKLRKKRHKNFLTRKYQMMPTHFWPKGWKRKKSRRAAVVEKPTPHSATDAVAED